MWWSYDNWRTVLTLEGFVRLRLKIRRCNNRECRRYHRPYRPEAEGRIVLPKQETGLDVIALVGALRHREHRSVPEIHARLVGLGLSLCERTVSNLIERYDELVATCLADNGRLLGILGAVGRLVVSIDGLQPHNGHEVLWVVRETQTGEVLLARSLLSATTDDLASLLGEVRSWLGALGPGAPAVAAVLSDGQRTIRAAVARVFGPAVPHQLCHFHYLREAARPLSEADRHAKKELKKRVRGVRAIERSAEGERDEMAQLVHDYCSAVRASLDDAGHPPLDAPGLTLRGRLKRISDSLGEVGEKGGPCPSRSRNSRR